MAFQTNYGKAKPAEDQSLAIWLKVTNCSGDIHALKNELKKFISSKLSHGEKVSAGVEPTNQLEKLKE